MSYLYGVYRKHLDFGLKETKFLGYQKLSLKEARILKIIKAGEGVRSVGAGEPCEIVLDKTPFTRSPEDKSAIKAES